MNAAQEFFRLSSADKSAVRAVVSEFVNTWNRHDMPGMHELDTENVEWINVIGNHCRGKAAVYKGHDTIHRNICAKTDMSISPSTIRAIPPDGAVAVSNMIFGPVTIPTGDLHDLVTWDATGFLPGQ